MNIPCYITVLCSFSLRNSSDSLSFPLSKVPRRMFFFLFFFLSQYLSCWGCEGPLADLRQGRRPSESCLTGRAGWGGGWGDGASDRLCCSPNRRQRPSQKTNPKNKIKKHPAGGDILTLQTPVHLLERREREETRSVHHHRSLAHFQHSQ